MSKKRIPVASGLFVEAPEGPRLVGSRCRTCKTPYFPKSAVCHNPECKGSNIENALFGPTGWFERIVDRLGKYLTGGGIIIPLATVVGVIAASVRMSCAAVSFPRSSCCSSSLATSA